MADLRRIVRRPTSGTVVVKNLDDQTNYVMNRDSFKVTAPPRHTIMAQRQRRYGGARPVGETHDNGTISWTALVRGATTDACLANVESMLAVLESAATDLFFEWKPVNATSSVFYEIRGPATWQSIYSSVQMDGAVSMQVEITIPVAPIAQLDRVVQTFAGANVDLTQIPVAIGGTAPALVDVGITCTKAISFMLMAWTPRAAAGPHGNHSPFGRLAGPDTAGTDGSWTFSMTNVRPDDFSGEIDLEIWARIFVAASTVNPRATSSIVGASSSGGPVITSPRYTAEWGQAGAPLLSTSNYQIYRLGVVPVPVNPDADPYWSLLIDVPAFAKLSSVLVVPARARACGATGVILGTAPLFLIPHGGVATTKTIRGGDLSGVVVAGTGEPLPDSGLGGSAIEMQPGLNDLMLLAAGNVPNTDGSVDSDITYTLSVTLTITPRVWLAKGT